MHESLYTEWSKKSRKHAVSGMSWGLNALLSLLKHLCLLFMWLSWKRCCLVAEKPGLSGHLEKSSMNNITMKLHLTLTIKQVHSNGQTSLLCHSSGAPSRRLYFRSCEHRNCPFLWRNLMTMTPFKHSTSSLLVVTSFPRMLLDVKVRSCLFTTVPLFCIFQENKSRETRRRLLCGPDKAD